MTQQEVAKVLGVSQSRVGDIERIALNKLRHPKFRKNFENIREILSELGYKGEISISEIIKQRSKI